MLRINLAPEPVEFDDEVRVPGLAFLATVPAGEKVDFTNKAFWREAIPSLRRAYRAVCAYTNHWIAYDVGSSTVEHFHSKSAHPNLAYEWSNFRLVCGRMNGRKGQHTDVVDPIAVVPGMFELDFPSLQVKAGTAVSGANLTLANTTIDRLNLNDEGCIDVRVEYVLSFRDSQIDFQYLTRKAPFIASEITRLGIAANLDGIMKDTPWPEVA